MPRTTPFVTEREREIARAVEATRLEAHQVRIERVENGHLIRLSLMGAAEQVYIAREWTDVLEFLGGVTVTTPPRLFHGQDPLGALRRGSAGESHGGAYSG